MLEIASSCDWVSPLTTGFAFLDFLCSLVMVKMLMGCKNLELKQKNLQGQDVTHIAAMHGQLLVLKYLLHKHEDRLTGQNFDQDGPQAVDEKGMVPLHYAVLKNNEEMVQFLIEHKSDEIVVGAFRKKKQTDSSGQMAKQLATDNADAVRANYMN